MSANPQGRLRRAPEYFVDELHHERGDRLGRVVRAAFLLLARVVPSQEVLVELDVDVGTAVLQQGPVDGSDDLAQRLDGGELAGGVPNRQGGEQPPDDGVLLGDLEPDLMKRDLVNGDPVYLREQQGEGNALGVRVGEALVVEIRE